MTQLTLCKNQSSFKSVGVRIFGVDLTWNDPILIFCTYYLVSTPGEAFIDFI